MEIRTDADEDGNYKQTTHKTNSLVNCLKDTKQHVLKKKCKQKTIVKYNIFDFIFIIL